MTTGRRQSSGGPGADPPGKRPDDDPRGTVHLTGPGPIAIFFIIGLIVGWSIRQIALATGGNEPSVSWISVGLIYFGVAVVGFIAWSTARMRREGLRLAPHKAVNRLVLGKTFALTGAALGGGYFGFAVAHLGVTASQRAGTELLRGAVGGVGGVALLVVGLLLELACRVPPEDR